MSTVKVRIAVAVDPRGYWVATGWKDADDNDLMDSAIEGVHPEEARYWITVELEIPEKIKTKEIKGEVENAN